MSRGKKILLVVLSVLAVIVVGTIALSAKVYNDISKTVSKTYETVERQAEPLREEEVSIQEQDAFSVLLMGIDTGDLGRVEQGRSDTMMIATVSPEKQQTTIVSIARDTYTEIVGYGTQDKINHAYAFGGASMSMDTVQKMLDIPVDHYISINMQGLKELVDAVGGITVSNTLDFSQDGYDFKVGQVELDGEKALSYSRMRYEDPNGDYGRQERQRKIVDGLARKLLTFSGAAKYKEVLDAVGEHVKTDMSFDDMKTLALNYRSALGAIKQDQLKGEGFMQDGVSYQGISSEEMTRVQTELKEQLGL
ncbi:LCP family protein [Enterococcus sp. BWB1-3]|uniref:LCP family glycopolymer transferase n=1 Tax=unclassified Enterococcus TaxID=2608891 RepID=UPI0019226733|nr:MULTISPECIES: LCP family protein [unclassified Enterococcus]MBL1229111.1 LCP family protein [Enterococcus sp. BWB1-3]MCB5952491.1 LCP family protein [Enterococcus sp. BWT-B8]MCB5953468.1 LCP family protein [Enterococcus sp. CWB-B31]